MNEPANVEDSKCTLRRVIGKCLQGVGTASVSVPADYEEYNAHNCHDAFDQRNIVQVFALHLASPFGLHVVDLICEWVCVEITKQKYISRQRLTVFEKLRVSFMQANIFVGEIVASRRCSNQRRWRLVVNLKEFLFPLGHTLRIQFNVGIDVIQLKHLEVLLHFSRVLIVLGSRIPRIGLVQIILELNPIECQ